MSNLIGDMYLKGMFDNITDDMLISAYHDGLADALSIILTKKYYDEDMQDIKSRNIVDRLESDIKDRINDTRKKIHEFHKAHVVDKLIDSIKTTKEEDHGQSSAGGDVDVGLLECTG